MTGTACRATCNDGTSYSGKTKDGACKDHGGSRPGINSAVSDRSAARQAFFADLKRSGKRRAALEQFSSSAAEPFIALKDEQIDLAVHVEGWDMLVAFASAASWTTAVP